MSSPPVPLNRCQRPRRTLALLAAMAALGVSTAAVAKETWSGELTLTLKGSGNREYPVKEMPGGKSRVSWNVDRLAQGRIVLDRMFKGGGIAGTPDTRNTDRYETWIADRAQPLELTVRDEGQYYGFIAPQRVALDEIRFQCPVPDERHRVGQVRSGILQFDRQAGTYQFETPRLIHRCATSHLRTPKHGPADWMARPPFDIRSNAFELEFDVWHGLNPSDEWRVLKGSYTEGATELVLSRRIVFQWMNPFLTAERPAPVEAQLQLVLRKSP